LQRLRPEHYQDRYATGSARAQQATNPTPALTKQIDALQKVASTTRATRIAFRDDTGSEHITFEHFKTSWKRLNDGIAKAEKNPSLMIYKLQTSAYK
jgi:hypothetical protein